MSWQVMGFFVLVGAGAMLAAVVGILLPRNYLLHAAMSLVFGAGVGVAALAIGAYATDATQSPNTGDTVFFVAALLGFVSVAGFLSLVWRKARTEQAPPPPPGL